MKRIRLSSIYIELSSQACEFSPLNFQLFRLSRRRLKLLK